MAQSGTRADLAQLNAIFQEFVEIEPLHAISTQGTQFLTAYITASLLWQIARPHKKANRRVDFLAAMAGDEDTIQNTPAVEPQTVVLPPQ